MGLVRTDGIVDIFSKVAQEDPDAAAFLLHGTLFEAFDDLIEAQRPDLEAAAVRMVSKQSEEARRILVKGFIEKRLAGEPVEGYLERACHLTLVEGTVSKALFGRDDPGTRWYDARGKGGRFVPRGTNGQPMLQTDAQGNAIMRNGQPVPMDFGTYYAGEKGKQAAQRFEREYNSGSRSRKTKAVGGALTSAGAMMGGPVGAGVATIGIAASVAGNLGPEAEAVLGPGMRRTAYRYRGTERRPDRGLRSSIGDVNGLAEAITSDASTTVQVPRAGGTFAARPTLQAADRAKVAEIQDQLDQMGDGPARQKLERELSTFTQNLAAEPKTESKTVMVRDQALDAARSAGTPAAGVALHYANKDMTPDEKTLRMRGDVAANYLARKLPDPEKTRLSIAAGQVPPSQGVIIDADGDVVSEAMGFNGDHYVPFDLKNLKRLQGGQYVRTRAAGGLTTEDIYTGLLAGARQVQVVSNSGVFTLEFDPELRGGKRYSDKARQMVGRYERILDTIDGGGLYRQDLDPATMRSIRSEIANTPGMTPDRAKVELEERLNEARFKQSFAMDDEEIDAAAQAQVREFARNQKAAGRTPNAAALATAYEDARRDLLGEARENQVREYKLDGAGYDGALKALQGEFPYFIRNADWQPLPDFQEDRGLRGPGDRPLPRGGGVDQGYTLPKATGATRSRAADNGRKWKGRGTEGLNGDEAPGATSTTGAGTGARTGAGAQGRTGSGPRLDPNTKKLDDAVQALPPRVLRESGQALIQGVGSASAYTNVVGRRFQEGTATEQEVMSPSTTPVDVLLWVGAKSANDDDAVINMITKGDEALAHKIVDSYRRLATETPPSGIQISQTDTEKMRAATDAAEKLVQLRTPWSAPADDTNLFVAPRPGQSKPLRFEEIADLGDKAANYTAYLGSTDRLTRDAINSTTPQNAASKVEEAITNRQLAIEWAATGNAGARPAALRDPSITWVSAQVEQQSSEGPMAKQVKALQKAWSFHAARQSQQAVEAIARGSGNPPAPQQAGPSTAQAPVSTGPGRGGRPSADFGKRAISVHGPDSELATEFRRFLSSRR